MPRRRPRRVLPRRGSGSPLTEARLSAQEVETYELVRLLHPRAALVGLESCELLRVRVERIHLHASFDGSRRSNAPLPRLEAPQRLVDVQLAARDLLQQLDPRWRRRRRAAVDAELRQKGVETRARGRIADRKVPFELLHVSARGEKDAKHVAVFVGEDAELTRSERARQLGFAGRTGQAGDGKPRAADGAICRRTPRRCAGHQATTTLTLPIVHSTSSVPAPEPTTSFLMASPSSTALPMVVRAMIRTLEDLSRLIRTEPISHVIELAPSVRRPVAATLPAATSRFSGPRKSSMMQLPAWTCPLMGPFIPLIRRLPAWTVVSRASDGLTRTLKRRPKSNPLMVTRRWGRLNSKLVSSLMGDCSMTMVSPSWRARCGPSATANATFGSPMISVWPNREMTRTCRTAPTVGVGAWTAAAAAVEGPGSRASRRAAPSSAVSVPAATWVRISRCRSFMRQIRKHHLLICQVSESNNQAPGSG